MVLCGVADQDGGLVAFFEDDQTGQTTRLGVGQRIRGGSIVGVTLDGVDYQTSSGTRRVAIGQTLSGAAANLGATSSPSTAPSPAAASGDSPAPGASAASGAGDKAVDDIVERMKKRRLAELNAAEAASTSKPATQDSKNDGANTSSTPGGAPSDSAPAGSTSSPSSPSSTGSIEQ
jgi:hypothetical protein